MLCLDIGNSQIYGGVYSNNEFTHCFRLNTKIGWSSDQLGIFFLSYFREQKFDPTTIRKIAISSVVPSINYSIRSACIKYFGIDPFFVKPGIKMDLDTSQYRNSAEMGADIIAGCNAAAHYYPDKNILVIDLGTATTIVAINKEKKFCGGVIIPGIKTQAESLARAAEKLSSIDIFAPKSVTGLSTVHAIQSGIYFSHLAALNDISKRMAEENFNGSKADLIIGTGGFATLFSEHEIFDLIEPDLVLKGIMILEHQNLTV